MPTSDKRRAISLSTLRDWLLQPSVDDDALNSALQQASERQPAPVLWLLGKTQSGKTSLIRALTGNDDGEIGNGFQPCTRTAQFYDFPGDAPLVRFLDTRGLGELAYDPSEDIQYCEAQAHLVIAVLKAGDPGQQAIFEVLQTVRKRHPDWPVVVVQSCLHQCCPVDWEHPQPYPFMAPLESLPQTDLLRALQSQRQRLGTLPGQGKLFWVAVDFTHPDDGFAEPLYGLEPLWDVIEQASAFGLQAQLRADSSVKDLYSRSAHPHIVSYSLAAAGVGALPLVDMALVPAIQLKLLHTIASLYQQPWNRRSAGEFFSLLGTAVAAGYGMRWAGRSAVKMIPVWGQTLGAAWSASSSAAITYALGKAACYYLGRRRAGQQVDEQQLREIYRQALHKGRTLARQAEERQP